MYGTQQNNAKNVTLWGRGYLSLTHYPLQMQQNKTEQHNRIKHNSAVIQGGTMQQNVKRGVMLQIRTTQHYGKEGCRKITQNNTKLLDKIIQQY